MSLSSSLKFTYIPMIAQPATERALWPQRTTVSPSQRRWPPTSDMRHCARCWKAEGPTAGAPNTQPRTRTPPPPENTQTKTSEVALTNPLCFTGRQRIQTLVHQCAETPHASCTETSITLGEISCRHREEFNNYVHEMSRNIDHSWCKDKRAGVVSAGRMTFMIKTYQAAG